ncbi:MAG TPA: TraR/DksA C4-type zinc finger protein [bacterium]
MRDESQAIVNQNMQSDLKPREESSDVGDDLDQASNERDREFNLIMHQRHLRRLQQIQEAFERIEEGSYGLCEGTDEPINPRRLLIMPLARYSLEYQEQQEKMMGRGAGGEGFYESGEESFSSDDL